jgi:hypothetical protein
MGFKGIGFETDEFSVAILGFLFQTSNHNLARKPRRQTPDAYRQTIVKPFFIFGQFPL